MRDSSGPSWATYTSKLGRIIFIHSLRPCLGAGASRRARVGRVRSLAFLSILHECSSLASDVQIIEVLLCQNGFPLSLLNESETNTRPTRRTAARERASQCWMTRLGDRSCSLSSFISAESITGSLQCPVYGVHHRRSVGVRQHSHLRCCLEFGQKLRSF